MIDIKNVYKSYSSGRGISYPVLKDITTEIREGKLTAIVGPSGAGKSTLLHILACIEQYDSGSVKVDGVELKTLSESEAANYRNSKIGIVLQNFALIPDFSVYENIILPLKFSTKRISGREMKNKAKALAEKLKIEDLLTKKVSEISGGEKQRTAIARALINSPKYIFADEPTGALDSKNSSNIVQILKNISKEGVGVVIVTHDKGVSDSCDIVIELFDGELV